MIERADLERVWSEIGETFRGEKNAADVWLERNEIDPDGMLEFLDSRLRAMIVAAAALAMEDGGTEEAIVSSVLSVAASMFFLGWESHIQLGKPSTHIAE